MAGYPGKRALDIVVSLVALFALWPVPAAISLLLLLAQGPPVLYRETRVGLNGARFTIYKFRTMHLHANEIASVAASNDPQLTAVGKWLKPSRLDELPQLINVLKGDMSVVGPRPLKPSHLATLPKDVRDRLLSVHPGITSPASLRFLAEDDVLAGAGNAEQTYLQSILPKKIEMHLDYIASRSLLGDMKILGRTLVLMWSPIAWQRSRDMISELLLQHRW